MFQNITQIVKKSYSFNNFKQRKLLHYFAIKIDQHYQTIIVIFITSIAFIILEQKNFKCIKKHMKLKIFVI